MRVDRKVLLQTKEKPDTQENCIFTQYARFLLQAINPIQEREAK